MSRHEHDQPPRVSIGLPVYNGERYLAETLNSLLAQTFSDVELVVCDNASTDATQEICRSYAAKDARIRYVRNKANIGGSRNFRLAFTLARGNYFRWAASDDLCAPKLIERCVEILDTRPDVVMAYPKTRIIDAESRFVADYDDGMHLQSPSASMRFRQLVRNLALANATYGLIRRSVLAKTRLLGDFIASDRLLLAELSLYGKFWEVPEPLFLRRIHAAAYSSTGTANELMQWFNPGTRNAVSCPELRHCWEYFRTGLRVPLAPGEKVRVLAHTARMTVWKREKIGAELLAAAQQLGQRVKSRLFAREACLQGNAGFIRNDNPDERP